MLPGVKDIFRAMKYQSWALKKMQSFHLTREGVHARGVIDGQHGDARLLLEQINGASREGLQLLPDLLLVEAVDAGALSLQQPERNIYTPPKNQVTF